MPYPPEYHKKFDLAKAQNDGDKVSATELCTELANVGTAVNQCISFLRSLATADKRIQPDQIMGTTFVIEDEQIATVAQTTITYANSVTVDPLVATVGVFINGERLPASQTTVQAADVIVTPALTAGDNIMLEIHDNADSVLSVLASTLNALGASLVGIEDIDGVYAASNVEDALSEVKLLLDQFITTVGDLTKYLKADVAVPLEVDQDAAGFTWKNLAPAVDPTDPVILQQINDVLAILTNLENTFLPLTGGIMQGPINMGGQRLTSLTEPVADNDAARKIDVDAVQTDVDGLIPTLGLQDPDRATQAQNIGTLSWSESPTAVASVPQDSGATVQTATGLPKPASLGDAVNLQKLNEVESQLVAQITALDSGVSGGNIPDGTVSVGSSLAGCDIDGVGFGTVPDLAGGGVFNFTSLNVVAAQTPTEDTFIFVDGDVTLTGNITMALNKLQISASGSITVAAACTITCHDLVLRAGTDITVDGVIAAHGNVQKLTALDVSVGGLVGFVSITAGAAVNMGAAATIDSAIINVQTGATSTMAATLSAYVQNGESSGFSGGGTTQVIQGPTFGMGYGLLQSRATRNELLQSTTTTQVLGDDARALLTDLLYTPSRYAGGGGDSTATHTANNTGGAGGAGGTAGGDGGAGEFGTSGGLASDVKGSYRPYLYPLAPGGAGGCMGKSGQIAEGGRPGGTINMYVVGDLVATGLVLSADAGAGVTNGDTAGGGGGGAIRAICTGTLTDCTANADGGAATGGTKKGGGGGGGGVHLIAPTFAGAQTVTAVAGVSTGGGGAVSGVIGTATVVTLTSDEILCLAGEGYWRQ